MNKKFDTLAEVFAELAASKGNISDCSNSYADYDDELKEHFLERYKKVIEFRRALSVESDRGCALFAASFLDCELENLLKKYLVKDKKIIENTFSYSGALGTFSSRIKMIYLLGIVDKKVYKDLELIRNIRNDFGHSAKFMSFDNESIKNRCQELYHCFYGSKLSARQKFTRVVCAILGVIMTKELSITNINPVEEITDEMKERNGEFVERMLKLLNISDDDNIV